jgi:hypothetical protein
MRLTETVPPSGLSFLQGRGFRDGRSTDWPGLRGFRVHLSGHDPRLARWLVICSRSAFLSIIFDIFPMNDGVLLSQLEELVGKLGIEIRYGNIPGEESHRTGGLCRAKGQYKLIIHSRLTVKEKIGVIIKNLKGF